MLGKHKKCSSHVTYMWSIAVVNHRLYYTCTLLYIAFHFIPFYIPLHIFHYILLHLFTKYNCGSNITMCETQDSSCSFISLENLKFPAKDEQMKET